MRTTRTLHPLNGQLRIAGATYFTHQVGIDLEDKILYIQDDILGELVFHEEEPLEMDFLDLEIPAHIRQQQRLDGWEHLTLRQLFDLVLATHHARGELS